MIMMMFCSRSSTHESTWSIRPCCRVPRRKVSSTVRSGRGRDCRDAFLGLMKTCQKLRVALWDYLGNRLGVNPTIAPRLGRSPRRPPPEPIGPISPVLPLKPAWNNDLPLFVPPLHVPPNWIVSPSPVNGREMRDPPRATDCRRAQMVSIDIIPSLPLEMTCLWFSKQSIK